MASKFLTYVEYEFHTNDNDELVEAERERFFLDDVEVTREEYAEAVEAWAGSEALSEMPSSAGRALREITAQ